MIKSPQQNELGKSDYGAIIFKEGDYYVAEDYNGITIKEDDTDAAKVFQAVIDEMTWGGLTYVKPATYYTHSTIEFTHSRIRMTGEMIDTWGLQAESVYSPMVKVSNDVRQIALENFSLNGNNKTAIVFDGTRTASDAARMTWTACHVYGATSKNMVFTNREGVLLSKCSVGDYPNTSPYNIYVDGMGGWVILDSGTVVASATTDSIYFKGNMLSIVNSEVHCHTGGSAQIRIVEGRLHLTNTWIDISSIRGIVGGGTSARLSSSNSFIMGGISGSFKYIHLNGDFVFSDFTHDIDCTVQKSLTGCAVIDGTIDVTGKYHVHRLDDGVYESNTIATDNETGTGAAQTIAHGLAATPTKIILWPITWQAHPHQTSQANAINLYLGAENTKQYGWQAEV